jgi:hypothetical protein
VNGQKWLLNNEEPKKNKTRKEKIKYERQKEKQSVEVRQDQAQ